MEEYREIVLVDDYPPWRRGDVLTEDPEGSSWVAPRRASILLERGTAEVHDPDAEVAEPEGETEEKPEPKKTRKRRASK